MRQNNLATKVEHLRLELNINDEDMHNNASDEQRIDH